MVPEDVSPTVQAVSVIEPSGRITPNGELALQDRSLVARAVMQRLKVTVVARIRPGDTVLDDGRLVEIDRIRRAPGRKPSAGENLELVGVDGSIVRRNSKAAIRFARVVPK